MKVTRLEILTFGGAERGSPEKKTTTLQRPLATTLRSLVCLTPNSSNNNQLRRRVASGAASLLPLSLWAPLRAKVSAAMLRR